jgi:hypothetical protein
MNDRNSTDGSRYLPAGGAGDFFDRAFAFAGFTEGVVEHLTELPFLPFDGPASPSVSNDAFTVAGRATNDQPWETAIGNGESGCGLSPCWVSVLH